MRIASSNVQLQASHAALSSLEVSERFELRVGGERARGTARGPDVRPPRPQVTISEQATAARRAEAAEERDPLDGDARLQLLRRMIEIITGRPVRTLGMRDRAADCSATEDCPPPARSEAPRRQAAGFSLEYDYRAHYTESEQTRFDASGVVRTADGREIRFDLAFELARSYTETRELHVRTGDARLTDPLVLDFAGSSASLSDLRFEFDLDTDGRADQVPLPAGGRGFLAIDRDGNGRIDDGRELFGPASGDGFAELAALDADGNGWIDESDPPFGQLRLWQPTGDGEGTLQTLAEAGVGALHTARVATPFALRGAANETLGMVRTSGVYLREDGSAGTLSQVDLSV